MMLAERRVLVTGASSGIGQAICGRLAREYTHLILQGRNEDKLQKAAEACESAGAASIEVLSCDLTNFDDVIHLIRSRYSGRMPEIFIHCAGTAPRGYLEDTPASVAAECFNLNTTAFYVLCQTIIPEMRERRYGQILAVSSSHAQLGLPGFAAYSGAKAGLERICQSLVAETEGTGITISMLSPGAVDTTTMRNPTSFTPSMRLRKPAHLRSVEQVAEAAMRAIQFQRSVTLGLSGKLIRHGVYWAPGIVRRMFEKS